MKRMTYILILNLILILITDAQVMRRRVTSAPCSNLPGFLMDNKGTNTLSGTGTQNVGGKVDSSAFFNATHSLIAITNADIQVGDETFTVSFWVKRTLAGNYPQLVLQDSTGKRNWGVWINHIESKFYFSVFRPTQVDLVSDTVSALNVWYHVMVWHKADVDSMFLRINNGATKGRATGGALQAWQGIRLYLGNYPTSGFGLVGHLDEVMLLKRVLTGDEQSAIYNSGNGVRYCDLPAAIRADVKAYYAFGGVP